MLNHFKKKHRILMLVSALLILISVWILHMDPHNDTNAWRAPWMRINDSFWEWSPSDWNIIAALFWNGSIWSSPYNRYWTGFCLPNQVIYVDSGNYNALLQNLSENTVYVFEPGRYRIHSTIIPKNCSAIVWQWWWEIYFERDVFNDINIFNITNKKYVILDNINIDANYMTWKDWIYTNKMTNSTFNNIEIHNVNWNVKHWIRLVQSNNNRLNRIKAHDNSIWISIEDSLNFISNSEIYNNNTWLQIDWSRSTNINNNQIYNNGLWIYIYSWKYNTINNNQIYNNTKWIFFKNTEKNLINNSNIYSNWYGIVYDAWSHLVEKYNYILSWNVYNNWYGIELDSLSSLIYYNTLWLFANTLPIVWDSTPTMRLRAWDPQSEFGIQINAWASILDMQGEMDRFLRTYPVDANWVKYISTWDILDLRRPLNWNPSHPIKYIAWKKIIKQVAPIWIKQYNNQTTPLQLLNEFNPQYFIATIDSETSERDDSIIEYYYWTDSEFTKNWNENNCNINIMTVEYIYDQTWFYENLLAYNRPLWHVIYVLASWNYTITDNLLIDNDCTAIVNYEWWWVNITYYPGINWSSEMIKVNWHENIILDWLSLNWHGNSTHNVFLWRNDDIPSNNNTINNIQSFKSIWNWIMLDMLASHNTIMNTQVWNNWQYWIEVFLWWEFNIINNSLSYNNQNYGIRFGNTSKYNSINNSQFFNNEIGGIFADLSTESNVISNVHTYNNWDYWINFKWSSKNTLNKVYAYNNRIWINIQNVASLGNTYISDLILFANSEADLEWTNWNDKFLSPWSLDIAWFEVKSDEVTAQEEVSIEPTITYSWCETNTIYSCVNSLPISEILNLAEINEISWFENINENNTIIDILNMSGFSEISWFINKTWLYEHINTCTQTCTCESEVNECLSTANSISAYQTCIDSNWCSWNIEITENYEDSNIEKSLIWINWISGYWTIITWAKMSCLYATNPQDLSANNIWFFQDNTCDKTWFIDTRDPTTETIPINYRFGLWISKQIAPIWYVGNSWEMISLLNNQHIRTSYIGDVNPIVYTNPGTISFSGAYTDNIEIGINHEINVNFTNLWILNHNFNIILWFTDTNIQWHIEIKQNGKRENVWMEARDINYKTLQAVRIIIRTPTSYLTEVEWTLYIWTEEYGHNTETFRIQTKANPTPPTITWTKNISDKWVWWDLDNIRQVKISWVYNTNSRYAYVDNPYDCNSENATNQYNSNTEINLKNYILWANSLDGKYICIYAKDTINWQVTTWISNQIKISSVEFTDDISVWPVYYETVNIDFNNTYNNVYTRIIDSNTCNEEWTQWKERINYEWELMANSDTYNYKYLCSRAEDGNGNERYFISSNSVNIINYSNIVNFIDGVSPSWTKRDIINIYFSDSTTFSHKMYKRVASQTDCANTNWMVNYTWHIIITNDSLNWYYFCMYTREANDWIENYLVSPHPLLVDSENPTIPQLLSPTSWESIAYIIFQTTWAHDDDSWIIWFEYQIAENGTFLDIVDEWYVENTNWIISPKINLEWWNYAYKIRAVDNAWNVSDSRENIPYGTFYYNELSWFYFNNITNAKRNTEYQSNSLTIEWLDEWETIRVEITNGTLYRNWKAKWTWTYVTLWDSIYIKATSSTWYNTTTTTNLIIANRVLNRSITTEIDEENTYTEFWLSIREQKKVDRIFSALKTMYEDESERLVMLYTLKNMVEDEIALWWDNINRLKYLLSLIEEYLNDENENWWKIHTAPNCKTYEIAYSETLKAFYSPDMQPINWQVSYFVTPDALFRFIDSKNVWWECENHVYKITSSYENNDITRHIAPNGKVYSIELTPIWYTSPNFSTSKYFSSLSEIRSYIDKNNPTISLVVRNHIIDKDFEPITYIAPNKKEYKIYHTNKWFMSYRLANVKYYPTIEALKQYIDKNNPKK